MKKQAALALAFFTQNNYNHTTSAGAANATGTLHFFKKEIFT